MSDYLVGIFAGGYEPGTSPDDVDRRTAELNRRREAMGRQTSQESARIEGAVRGDRDEWDSQVADAFMDGAGDGLENIQSGIKTSLTAPAAWIWGAIPWWIRIAALLGILGALVWYTGAYTQLRGRWSK
jgi:hypothetical protein